MPLEAEFVQYLATLNSSEAEFNSLPLVERSTIRRNFSPAQPGADGGLVVLATTIQELSGTVQQLSHVVNDMNVSVQQLSHVVHELKDSTASCFQSLNDSVTNLCRKIPSPSPSPIQQPGTNASSHGDDLAQIPAILQFEEEIIDEAVDNGVEPEIETIYATDSDLVHASQE
mmetsp:Transcript_13591/g.18413  ORF Transcript_13591/g.18413 Transcript_13591/m.18413 type:complete len:172 (-) Transcript_13591:94-609(-)